MTLGELLEGKTLPVKVKNKNWGTVKWFNVIAISNIEAIGFDPDGLGVGLELSSNCFELYQEPKKTKIVYEWMYRWPNDKVWILSAYLYSEDEAEKEFKHGHSKTGRSFEVPDN